MKRRQAFTLVELLVCMALIMFMMAILSQAFISATGVFRNLKASGDMAEKLRAVTTVLQRDLSADHFEGKKRLSDPNFWLNGPPQQGFFQILQSSADTQEGVPPTTDLDGIGSYRAVNHSLAFTIKERGNQMGDFLTAGPQGGGSVLNGITTFGPPEARYQATSGAGSYNYQWAEVAWFMVAQTPDTTATDPIAGAAGPAMPLYTLYRRQRLLVPDNSLVPQQTGNAAQFLEVSNWQPQGPTGPVYFNSPIDITDPQRRFGGITDAFQTLAAQGATGGLAGADIQLTNVVSFDVRVLVQGMTGGVDPFVTLFDPRWTTAPPGGLGFTYSAPPGVTGMVFDTWSSLSDGLGNSYAQWNTPQTPTSIPLWNGSSGPTILAIQIVIRIWDEKTHQTREVTIVQAM